MVLVWHNPYRQDYVLSILGLLLVGLLRIISLWYTTKVSDSADNVRHLTLAVGIASCTSELVVIEYFLRQTPGTFNRLVLEN